MCAYNCCKTKKFFWKNVLGKNYNRLKNMWDLLHLLFLLCVGNTTATFFYWGSFAKAAKIKIFHVEKYPAADAAVGKSSHFRFFAKKVFLKISQELTGKHLCWSLFLTKLRLITLLKRYSNTCFFPLNFAKLLRTSFLRNTFGQLITSV